MVPLKLGVVNVAPEPIALPPDGTEYQEVLIPAEEVNVVEPRHPIVFVPVIVGG